MSIFDRVVPALAQALATRGYETLTPVQTAVLEPELRDADLLVSAQTGSGKTVAFGMAIAPTLLGDEPRMGKAGGPLALVIAPTRELALQVKRELDWLYAGTGASIVSCVGGMDTRTERLALGRGAHIVVGTPGRLRDHITRRALVMDELRAVVLDEADEMLDLGFREDLEFMLDAAPAERRTLLFSATVAAPIARLAKSYQRDAVRLSTREEERQHGDIEYRALVVAPGERENAIVNVLRFYEPENVLVFCNTRATVNHMLARFSNRGFSVVALSGELSQNERTHALQAMRDGRAKVCIATDVAARGIDLPNLDLVIHADLPSNPETLLHRSGRTGRAGRKGVSALMVDVKGRRKAERLLQAAKIDATWATPPSAQAVLVRDEERILADPMLSDVADEDEAASAARLLEKFTPEQVATAFLRLGKAGRSAPEDIATVSLNAPNKREFVEHPGKGAKIKRDFDNSQWVTLSVGRKQNAEPRWLIPLLCNAGEMTKAQIGYIRIEQNQTHVELDGDHAAIFLDAIGPNQTLEKNVRVKVLEAKPSFDAQPKFEKPGGFDKRAKFERPDKPAYKSGGKPKPWKAKGDGADAKPHFEKPTATAAAQAPGKTSGKTPDKTSGKEPWKAKGAGKPDAGGKPKKFPKGGKKPRTFADKKPAKAKKPQ
ncbi:DEAD/DEAH box helicase [Rhizobiaceae bacterium]|nr:DEAD/DEAH box helicase [Rhizobiaceae bacterium]